MALYIENKENYEGLDIGPLVKYIVKYYDAKHAAEFVDTLQAVVSVEITTPEGVVRSADVRFDNIHLVEESDDER